MITLQKYLNNLENKQEIKEINLTKIQQGRSDNELLEGGELDLREFKNLEKLKIDPQFLTTPLVKLNVDGLIHLKEVDWLESKKDTEEEKKLWTELGIENENEKKEVVKEVNKLVKIWTRAEDEPIKVHFATEKAPKEQLQGKNSASEKTEQEFNIYLNLERTDKQGNFCPNLVFWSLTRELTLIDHENYDKDLSYWDHFDDERSSVSQNLIEKYQKEFELLFKPSEFPHERLEMSELLTFFYPNAEITDSQESKAIVKKEIVDKTWWEIKSEILQFFKQELEKNPSEEEMAKLGIKATVNYQSEQEYIIQVNYHSENPFKNELEKLITNTPLKLENEHLKEEKEQLPTNENFLKLKKQIKVWENSLLDLGISEENYQKIKEEVDKIT